MTRCLDYNLAHTVVFIEIILCETQFLAVEEVLQGPTVSTKITSVDEKIRTGRLSMVENHRFRHDLVALAEPYNALSVRGFRPRLLAWITSIIALGHWSPCPQWLALIAGPLCLRLIHGRA